MADVWPIGMTVQDQRDILYMAFHQRRDACRAAPEASDLERATSMSLIVSAVPSTERYLDGF